MKIVLAGASGFVGTPLVAALSKKNDLICFKRKINPGKTGGVREVVWDPLHPGDWVSEIEGVDAVINLAGEPIAGKRWTAHQKKELIVSRLNTTRALVEAIAKTKTKPGVFINASAVGYYGARDNSPLDENSSMGAGFLPELCREWERQALKAESLGVRVVLLRTGIVLGRRGGALAKMLPPFRMGLGGPIGNGRQVMSWIHLEDEVNAIIYALEHSSVHGPVNLTAPASVTMSEFARTLGKVLRRPAFFPVPGFVLKVVLGEMSELLLTGQNVRPKALLDAGYRFKYAALEDALSDLTK